MLFDNNEDLFSYMIGCIMGGMVKSYFYFFIEEIVRKYDWIV